MASLLLSSKNAYFLSEQSWTNAPLFTLYKFYCKKVQKMDYMFYEQGFLYKQTTYCSITYCPTVQFILWLFVCALGVEAMKISKSVLIDHKLILLSNNFTLVLSTELAVTPDCVIYWVAFLTMNKPYSHPEAINPSVNHEAVACSVSVISIT